MQPAQRPARTRTRNPLSAPALLGFALLGSALNTTPPPALAAAARPDLVVADFEGETYGAGWVATGGAFGGGPARGTLPGQMVVAGFVGRGLVNSFRGGDDATGTLTSPPFTIERPCLNFLIGGGGFAGETCLNLRVGGKVVRTATGPNTLAGGSERLDWSSWDVSELLGKTAVLEVVDRKTGGWGHVNLDQVVQSDVKRGPAPASRELTAEARYLLLPVDGKAPVRRVKVASGGRTVREFDVKLAEGRPEFWVSADLDGFRGKTVRVETMLPEGSVALAALRSSDEPPGSGDAHREPGRPQFHFTSRRGWLNDPNGLVFHEGEYHLFYQHNPYGWDWGNMHWGHAVSPDLVHWEELPEALTPREYGDFCFSGSAVVDARNTSGFGRDGKPPLVLAYTSTGRGECIASSVDRGRSWSEYERNPVVKRTGRDPKILWHAASSRWVMAVYDEEGGGRWVAFHTSPDLKNWTFRSRISGFYECPDLFELHAEGLDGPPPWVLSAADGEYLLGQFDGERFTPSPGGKHRLRYGNFYAAQTFNDAPGGRRVQIGWAQGVTFPGRPFNQQMTVPCELSLRSTGDGVRMFARPVEELAALEAGAVEPGGLDLKPGANVISGVAGELLRVRVTAGFGGEGTLTVAVHGIPVVYDAARRTLSCQGVSAPLAPEGGRVLLDVMVDRGSVEVFGNDGRVAISRGATAVAGAPPLVVSATGPATKVESLKVNELRSAWATRAASEKAGGEPGSAPPGRRLRP